jgi:hypothetical protein
MNDLEKDGIGGDFKHKLVDAIRRTKKSEYEVTFDSNHYI